METASRHHGRHIESPARWKRHSNHRPDPQATAIPRRQNPGSNRPQAETPVWKRAFDLGLILIILPVILVIALLVYCWIKVVSSGPVLFRQTRIGRGGKSFTIYKFRSMKPMAESSPHEAHVEHLIKSNQPMVKLDLSGDPRVIPGCRLIRMSGLDELPQLFNVLRGEMSLVGPRPCTPNEYALYEKYQLRRFTLQPGLTGLWQVKRTHSTTFREMVAMDDLYVDRLSLALDFKIVLETPGVLAKQLSTCLHAPSDPVRPQAFENGASGTQRPG